MHEQHRSPSAVSIAPRDAATNDHDECERIAALDWRIAAMRARAARSAWRLDVLPGGVFELWKWSRVRRFDALDQAEQFIAEVAQ